MTSELRRLSLSRTDYLIIAGWGILLLVLLGGKTIPANFITYRGDALAYYSLEMRVRELLANHQWPLWNMYRNQPLLADPQSSSLYPVTMLLRVLPLDFAMHLSIIVHVFLAGVGMYLVIRDFDLGIVSATTGMICYALSTTVIWHILAGHLSMLNAVPWIPFLFFSYRRLLISRQLKMFYYTLFCTICLTTSGHIQFSAIGFIVPGAYFFYFCASQILAKNKNNLLYVLTISAVLAIVAFGVLAVQLIPTLEYLKLTSRGRGFSFDDASLGLLPRHMLIGMVLPFWTLEAWGTAATGLAHENGLYTILPAVGFALLALFETRQELRTLAWCALGLGLFTILIALGLQTPIYRVIYHFINFMRVPGRFLIIWAFCISLLIGIGVNVLFDTSSSLAVRVKLEVMATVILFPVIVLGLLNFIQIVSPASVQIGNIWGAPSLKLTLPVMVLWMIMLLIVLFSNLDQRWKHTILVAAVVLDAVGTLIYSPTWSFFVDYLPSNYPTLVEQGTFYQSLDLQPSVVRLGYLDIDKARIATMYRVPVLEDYSAALLYTQDIMDFSKERRARILAAAYQVTLSDQVPKGWKFLQRSANAVLSVDPANLPRVFATTRIKSTTSDAEEIKLLSSTTFDLQDTTLIHAQPGEISLSGESLSASLTVLEYTPNTIRVRVETDQPAMIGFVEAFYPGWVATVNGKEANIWRLNHASRGVLVDSGISTIDMCFVSPSFYEGLRISLVTLISLIGLQIVMLVMRARSSLRLGEQAAT